MTNDRKLAIRIPSDVYAQAEQIRATMATKGRRVKTSAVLRMAIERGLTVLQGDPPTSAPAATPSASAMATHEAIKARIQARQRAG